MTKTERLDRLRNLFAILAGILGIIGFATENGWITGAGLGFVVAYIGAQIMRANATINAITEEDKR